MVGRQQEKIREGSNLNNTTTCCSCQKHLTKDKEKHVALMLANTETLAMFKLANVWLIVSIQTWRVGRLEKIRLGFPRLNKSPTTILKNTIMECFALA